MIDFRYHLVSIIAVFLALAIGIVLGTTALNSALLDDLRANISSLTQDKDDLRGQVADLQTRLDDAGAFTEATASALLAGRLAGRQVVVVAAPGAPGDVREAVVAGVEDAGGEVVGPVLLQADFLTRDQAEVDDLVRRLAPAGVTLPAGSGPERLGALLASVLVTTSTAAPGATGPAADAATTTDAVLDGLREAGLVRVQGERPEPAPLAVLVAAPGPVEGEAVDEEVLRSEQQALLALARALRSRSLGTVVAGPDEPPGGRGLVAALRADDTVADQLSSVDDAGSPQGRVATVFGLLEAWRGGVGHYGRGDRTSGPLPVPLPAGLPAVGAVAPGGPAGVLPGASAGPAGRDPLALHPPALGPPAPGPPALGLPAPGPPALSLPALGRPALGLPALGLPALGLPALGPPALGPVAAGRDAVRPRAAAADALAAGVASAPFPPSLPAAG